MSKTVAYLIAFLGALALTLILTPIVRELHRRIGLVDKPDPRRINKVPIPRGGGVALVLGVFISYFALHFATGRPALQGISDEQFYKLAALAVGVAGLGLTDDKIGLKPLVKLIGQIAFAFGVWVWVDLGFADLWPSLPMPVDCALTVFWLVGAMNAFNLIDGLDGLATGLALIASIGMAGSLFLSHNPQSALFYFALAGGFLGFLRYNYNPASVFLGDSGSMFIGFILAALPLCSHVPHSFLVSIGVPLLAMGVPIFDTALAILRRTIRHFLRNADGASDASGRVMTADVDHLHHRILRASGFSQRRAAWVLYIMAAVGVSVGLVGVWFQSRSAGLWIAALAVAAVVIFRDMAFVELYDAGQLMNAVARDHRRILRRRIARLSKPYYVCVDVALLILSYFVCITVLRERYNFDMVRIYMPIRVVSVFIFLAFSRTYVTVWSRATTYNYLRLFLACVFGAVLGTVAVYYYGPNVDTVDFLAFLFLYAMLSFLALMGVRQLRVIVRDLFYRLDCARLKSRKDVSRILVYGAGLRYRAFRRELVRSTSANDGIIVGIIDDDLMLKDRYVGDMKVLGSLQQAVEVINAVNADTVVIACEIPDDWMTVIRKTLAPTGVRIQLFTFEGCPKHFIGRKSNERQVTK